MKILGGSLRGRLLKAPKSIRPASALLRQAIFNICQAFIPDAKFLDIFAGSGAMGLEALSRGASSATFIDNNKVSISFIQKNIEALNLKPHCHILLGDALHILEKKILEPFDFISIDPPFIFYTTKPSYINDILNTIAEKKLISKDGIIFLEETSISKRDPLISSLKLKDTRKFGGNILHQYVAL
jgi:16S rRNA (guanine966-N2)-methyltransferase